MAKKQGKVQCVFCKKELTGEELQDHYTVCKTKDSDNDLEIELIQKAKYSKPKGNKKVFVLKISSMPEPYYWLLLEVAVNTTLKKLDSFVRDIWLECCGHLSSFSIEGVCYDSDDISYFDHSSKAKSMNISLQKILSLNMLFDYQYDFGATTHLKFKVITEGMVRITKTPIKLLARNPEPAFVCAACSQPASSICTECLQTYCGICVDEHECAEDMLLPLVNSPRTGMCAYTG